MGWKGITLAGLALLAGIVALAWVLVGVLTSFKRNDDALALIDRQVVDGRVTYRVLHPDYKERTGGLLTDWQDPESGCHYWITPDGTYVNLIPRWHRNGTPMCPDAQTTAPAKWVAPVAAPRKK
jgi:hypothetical protein